MERALASQRRTIYLMPPLTLLILWCFVKHGVESGHCILPLFFSKKYFMKYLKQVVIKKDRGRIRRKQKPLQSKQIVQLQSFIINLRIDIIPAAKTYGAPSGKGQVEFLTCQSLDSCTLTP